MTLMTLDRQHLRNAIPRSHHLYRVAPHNDAHRVALRAAASIAIPLLVLWSTGQLQWALYAVFGAFASLYGRSLPHLTRMRMQGAAGMSLAIAVTIGAVVATVPDNRWLCVGVVTVYAMLVSVAGERLGWHPVGPIFAVFGIAAVASVPGTASRIPVAFGVAAASALVAVVIGGIGRLRPSLRRSAAVTSGAGALVSGAFVSGTFVSGTFVSGTGGSAEAGTAGWLSARARAEALRYGAAVLIAGAVATATGTGHPYWSMVAAVTAVTGPDTQHRLAKAVHRIAGTLFGILIAAALLAPHFPVLVMIAIVAALQGAAELLVGRHYAMALLFITPLALMMGELVHPASEWTLLHERIAATVLGAIIGIVVTIAAHHLEPPNRDHQSGAR